MSEQPNEAPRRCFDWLDVDTTCQLERGHVGYHEDDNLRWEWK